MTALASRDRSDSGADGFEVATTSSDALQASVRVRGALESRTVPLLLSVLRTHLRAGRRYLHVDLADAVVDDPDALHPLRQVHASTSDRGGLLTVLNADEGASAALLDGELFASAST
jgi:hypothetical protein